MVPSRRGFIGFLTGVPVLAALATDAPAAATPSAPDRVRPNGERVTLYRLEDVTAMELDTTGYCTLDVLCRMNPYAPVDDRFAKGTHVTVTNKQDRVILRGLVSRAQTRSQAHAMTTTRLFIEVDA